MDRQSRKVFKNVRMKKLIIIGANNFQLPLILKAKAMDIETHVFAWEEGAVGKEFADYFYPISIVDKEAILKIAKTIKPDGVLSIASDLATITVNYLVNELNLTGNSVYSSQLCTNKYLMRQVLSENGLPCPGFKLFAKGTDSIEDLKYPLIVKPTDRSGSRGVTKVEDEYFLQESIQRAINESFSKEAIVEEFIEGKEYSIEMISWNEVHYFLQITEKETTGSPYFVEKAQHQPAQLSDALKEKIISIIDASLTVLDINYGASHSEIIVTEASDVYITEIGARMGGDYIGSDLVYLSTGFDFVKAVIEVSLGIEPKIELINNCFSGVCFMYPPQGKVVAINNNAHHFPEIVRTETYVKVDDYIGEIKESNQRKACYIYKTSTGKFTKNDVLEIVTDNFVLKFDA